VKILLVGYSQSGKSTLFEWLVGAAPDPAKAHLPQSAMAEVPDDRFDALCSLFHPKKTTRASIEIVDTPGLDRNDHEGNAPKLAQVRDAGCLVVVVAARKEGDPLVDLRLLEDDFLLADLSIVTGRIEKLNAALKKPRPDHEENRHEIAILEPLARELDSGKALRHLNLSPEQKAAIRSFQLFSEKPRLVVFNTRDDEPRPERFVTALSEAFGETPGVAVSLPLQLELASMPPDERDEFCREMNVTAVNRGALLRTIMEVSGQQLFFTAEVKEVHAWMIDRGATAVEAAGSIHTDLARGFIRAEVMHCDDLLRLGSEREVKAHNLLRHEPKDYVVADGDILYIRFSV